MESTRFTLVAFFAHPDDEAFGTGGTLTKYAAEGCDVYLVTATRGEAGEIAQPDLATKANLSYVRELELRCACETYGINPPRFLDYADGRLTVVNQGQAVAKLVRIIRALKPHVLITFGPDGIYGHYDHIAVHRWASIAFRLAADRNYFPDQLGGDCELHQISKLYFRVLSEDRVAAMSEDGGPSAVMMDGVPFYLVGRPREEITTVIDVSDYVGAKLRGLQCHVTQIGRETPFAETPEEVMAAPWFREETFLLGGSTVGWPREVETDLLAGLR